MLTLKLPADLEQRLNQLSEKTKRPKSFYMCEALVEYLEEYEDAFLALDRLNKKNAILLSTRMVRSTHFTKPVSG